MVADEQANCEPLLGKTRQQGVCVRGG